MNNLQSTSIQLEKQNLCSQPIKWFTQLKTVLLRVKSDIVKNMDQNKVTCLILLYLSAAFDTVDHELLLNHLRYRYGIIEQALEWIHSYLTDRTQEVVIHDPLSGGAESEKAQPARGVLWGSVLGPILFTLYVSPLGNICRNHGIDFHSYADDQQNYCAFSSMVPGSKDLCLGQQESCLSDVRTWMQTNLIK